VNLLVTYVPRWSGSNVKTPRLKHQWFPDIGLSGGPPDGARIVIIGRTSFLCNRTSFLMERPLLLFRRGPSLCAAFFLTWLMWIDQVSRVSRVTPGQRAVSTHWIGSPKSFPSQLFQILISYYFLFSILLNFSRFNLSTWNFCASCLLTDSLINFCNY
jgi:hypothetical protein